ncbi:MAG: tripartite tricarboxylate transporter permease [Spirochaetales bacterium]|jgi:putative tricarboxylic transport membrane protein|nr:tripartite tricarboxylate transporter permease [Spirochaetales bacterium]
MLDMFAQAFSLVASSPSVLLLCLLGTILGIFFGASPGMTSSMGIALILPVTYGMTIVHGMSILLGIYIGSMSGGLITAILINIPGTPASVATTFDGYPLARRGEGGRAIRVGTLYSLMGGVFSLLILFFISPLLARAALRFGPVEYFSVAFFSVTLIASLSGNSMLKGAISAALGVMFTTVGMAPVDTVRRYTFGIFELDAGFKLLPVLVGVFAVMEVIKAAEDPMRADMKPMDYKAKGIGVTWKEFRQQLRNFFVSSCIGTGIGILPGLGAAISNLIAYSVSRNSSRYPEKYGTGIIDGIVASESANNAVTGGALVPLLTMGIPGDAGTAMLLAAFMLHGITPGPLLFNTHGHVIYAMFVILIIANILMFLIQIYGLPVFLKLLRIPRNILFPIIMVLASVGAFAMNNRIFDIWSIFIFALVGYGLSKFDFPAPPLVLGFVLGPLLELNLRRGLMATYGSFGAFFTRPISGTFLALTGVFILYNVLKRKV